MDRAKVEEEEEAVEMFDRCRGRRRSPQVLLLLLMVSWSSARAIAVLRNSSFRCVELPACLLNHHVVFLIWNAIAVVLFVLCRRTGRNADRVAAEGSGSPAAESVDKDQIAMSTDEISRNDDVAAAIETAARQIEKFQKTQSAKLKQEIGARRSLDLRRSESENCLITMREEEIETLSSDEFRRRVDAFIDAHWGKRRQISA